MDREYYSRGERKSVEVLDDLSLSRSHQISSGIALEDELRHRSPGLRTRAYPRRRWRHFTMRTG